MLALQYIQISPEHSHLIRWKEIDTQIYIRIPAKYAFQIDRVSFEGRNSWLKFPVEKTLLLILVVLSWLLDFRIIYFRSLTSAEGKLKKRGTPGTLQSTRGSPYTARPLDVRFWGNIRSKPQGGVVNTSLKLTESTVWPIENKLHTKNVYRFGQEGMDQCLLEQALDG